MLEKGFFPTKKTEKVQGSIMESLTPKRMEILKKARLERGFTNVWTSDGKILCKNSTENKVNGSKDMCFLYVFYFFSFYF